MRKLACAIITIMVLAGGLLLLPSVHAATDVYSSINVNTTWTPQNSPYNLKNNIAVYSGVTLTIQPGVTVNFGSYNLQVSGTLSARGANDNKIVFSGSGSTQKIEFTSSSTKWSDVTSSGCIIDNAIVFSVPIVVDIGFNNGPKISNTYFTRTSLSSPAILVNGGNTQIANNVILVNAYANGIQISGGTTTIGYNTIAGNGNYYGIYTEAPATITNNNIVACYTGIYTVGASNIENNIVQNNAHDGIRSNNSATRIQWNAISNNPCGVAGTGIIQNNTITGSSTAGIWGPYQTTTIKYNNLLNEQNVHLTEPENYDATNNWWETTDPQAISQSIWDYKNDSDNLGTLAFEPFLVELNPSAPSVPGNVPVPTPPPTPAPPTITPTPKPSSSAVPTWEPTPTETPGVIDYSTPTPYPTQTPLQPLQSPDETAEPGVLDLANIAVICLAIMTTILIIVFLNKKFSSKQQDIKTLSYKR